MSMLKKPTVHIVGYSIPHKVVGMGGRPNRAADPRLRITPGAAEPIEISWQDDDGIALSLLDSRAFFTVWSAERFADGEFMDSSTSSTVIVKDIEIKDPHAGIGFLMLRPPDTLAIGSAARGTSLRWGVTLVTRDGPFPCSMNSDGARWGQIIIDRLASLPPGMYELPK